MIESIEQPPNKRVKLLENTVKIIIEEEIDPDIIISFNPSDDAQYQAPGKRV